MCTAEHIRKSQNKNSLFFYRSAVTLEKKNYKLLQVLIVNGYNSVEKRNVIT